MTPKSWQQYRHQLGQVRSVQLVGLGQLAGGHGKVFGLPGIDACNPQASLGTGIEQCFLVASRGLDHHTHITAFRQLLHQLPDPDAGVVESLHFGLSMDGNIQEALPHIHPNCNHGQTPIE